MTKKFDINDHLDKIVVYSKDKCPQCKFLKQYLTDNDITYHEVNIEEYGEDAIDHVRNNYGTALPVCVYRSGEKETFFTGFNPVKAKEIVTLAKS